MEPKRTLHSGNLVRGDRKLFMEKYYMELGTCFVREDLLRDGVRKIDGRKKNELENY